MVGREPRICGAVVNAIFSLLRAGCQWRLLPREFPPWGTVYHYFRFWDDAGVWVQMGRALYEQARVAAGRAPFPSSELMIGLAATRLMLNRLAST